MVRVGDRVDVLVNDRGEGVVRKRNSREERYKRGVVKHVGHLYVGIELDRRMDEREIAFYRRKGQSCDGVFLGKRYFRTESGRGIFVFSEYVRSIRGRSTAAAAAAASSLARSRTDGSERKKILSPTSDFREALSLAKETFRVRPVDDGRRTERRQRRFFPSEPPAASSPVTPPEDRRRSRESPRRNAAPCRTNLNTCSNYDLVRIFKPTVANKVHSLRPFRSLHELAAHIVDPQHCNALVRSLRSQGVFCSSSSRSSSATTASLSPTTSAKATSSVPKRRTVGGRYDKRSASSTATNAAETSTTCFRTTQPKSSPDSATHRRHPRKVSSKTTSPRTPETPLRVGKPYNMRHVSTGGSVRLSTGTRSESVVASSPASSSSPSPVKLSLDTIASPSKRAKGAPAATAYISHAIWLALVAEMRQPPRALLNPDGTDSAFDDVVEHAPNFRGDLSFSKYHMSDYAPAAFRALRDIFDVTEDAYLQAMSSPLIWKGEGEGKSGSHFYFTHDRTYVLKTVKPAEVPVLRNLLSDYFKYFALRRSSELNSQTAPRRQQQCSCLPRFMGLHRFTMPDRPTFTLVVMRNVLNQSEGGGPMHRVFDLKGSLLSRWVPPLEKAALAQDTKVSSAIIARPSANSISIDTRTLKDLNFNAHIYLSRDDFTCLTQQLRCDVALLSRYQLMDFSLLLGVRFEGRVPWMRAPGDDVMPHTKRTNASSSTTSAATSDNGLLRDAVLKTYTSREVMASLLPESGRTRVSTSVREWSEVPASSASSRHVVFVIQVHVYDRADEDASLRDTWVLYRRYSEFDRLASSINAELRKTGAQWKARLPPKRYFSDNFDPKFLEDRRVGLELWLRSLLRLFGDKVALSPSLRKFLTDGANRPPPGVLLLKAKRRVSDDALERLKGVGVGRGLRAYLAPAGVVIRNRKDLASKAARVTLWFGIIDILQEYNAKKRVESMYKSFRHKGSAISAIESTAYGARFLSYITGDIFRCLENI